MRLVHKRLYPFSLCKLNATQQECEPKHFSWGGGGGYAPHAPVPPRFHQ